MGVQLLLGGQVCAALRPPFSSSFTSADLCFTCQLLHSPLVISPPPHLEMYIFRLNFFQFWLHFISQDINFGKLCSQDSQNNSSVCTTLPGADWILKPAMAKTFKRPFLPFLSSFFFVSNRPWAAQNQAAHVTIVKTPQRPVRLWTLLLKICVAHAHTHHMIWTNSHRSFKMIHNMWVYNIARCLDKQTSVHCNDSPLFSINVNDVN